MTCVAWIVAGGTVSCSSSSPTTEQPCAHQWIGTSASLTHSAPLSELDFGQVGYCATDPVSIALTQGGHTLSVGATSANPLRVIVPPWFDGASGGLGNADVRVTVNGPDGAHPVSGLLHIDALAADTSGAPTGSRSLAILASVTAAVIDARGRLTSFHGNTGPLDASFGTVLAGLNTLANGIQQVQSTGTPIALLKVPSGATVTLTPSSLGTLDALFVASLGAMIGAPQSSAATAAAGDTSWFQSMVGDVTKGSLDSAREFSGRLGTLLAVMGVGAAILGAETAAAPLALMGAIVYVSTTFAPAATALILDLGASAVGDGPDGPITSEAYNIAIMDIQYVVEQSISKAVSAATQGTLDESSPTAAAVHDVIDNAIGISDGVAERVASVIFGRGGQCANGAVPTEISFNPDSVTCPGLPSTAAEPTSGTDSGGSNNICFVGDAVQLNSAPWIAACQTLNAKYTQVYNCLDPSSGPGLGVPHLPDGRTPSIVCVPFTDSTGVGTSIGQVSGCNRGDPGYTQCWCCPG